MNIKNKNGVTIISLVITIIVLLIISSITIYKGTNSIKEAKLESLKTNMLLIKAKAKEYVEQASFKNGTSNEIKDEAKAELKGNEIQDFSLYTYINKTDEQFVYDLTNQLEDIGLHEISIEENEKYIVKYDIKNVEVEIYNTKGYDDNGSVKHSLTELENINN